MNPNLVLEELHELNGRESRFQWRGKSETNSEQRLLDQHKFQGAFTGWSDSVSSPEHTIFF